LADVRSIETRVNGKRLGSVYGEQSSPVTAGAGIRVETGKWVIVTASMPRRLSTRALFALG
jgi:hypothetical protein